MRKSIHICALVMSIAMMSVTTGRAAVLIPIIPVPGSMYTDVYGINNNNVIVGGYFMPNDDTEHGFFGTLDGQYTTFDYGAFGPEGRGINDSNLIVGYYHDQDFNQLGFERSPDGSIKTITMNDEPLVGAFNQGINSKGLFVGDGYSGDFETYHSYYGKKGEYREELTIPLGGKTTPRGINDSNTVVGRFTGDDGAFHGFVLRNGVATQIDYPDNRAVNTYLSGINNKGLAEGSWEDEDGIIQRGFVLDTASGDFIPLKAPNSKVFAAWAINDNGLVIVSLQDGLYIYCMKKKKCPKGGVEIADSRPIHARPGTSLRYGDAFSKPAPRFLRSMAPRNPDQLSKGSPKATLH